MHPLHLLLWPLVILAMFSCCGIVYEYQRGDKWGMVFWLFVVSFISYLALRLP